MRTPRSSALCAVSAAGDAAGNNAPAADVALSGWRACMKYWALGSAGALSVIGWEPYGWWPALLSAYAVFWWYLAATKRPFSVACQGLVFGLAQHVAGHGWLYFALKDKVGLSAAFSFLASTVFVTYLAMFIAVPCFIWGVISERAAGGRRDARILSAVTLAALLTLGEWARSLCFNGFTSLSAGYALIDTPISGYAPVFGVYGVSFFAYTLAFLPVTCFGISSLGAWRQASLFMLLIVAVGVLGTYVPWVEADGQQISFRLIQASVRQERKFDPLYQSRELERLNALITSRPATIIVTPETAFPVLFHQLPATILERLHDFSTRTGSHLLLGIVATAATGDGHNSLVHLSPRQGDGLAFFNKTRLMPFGEYSPLGFAWFTRRLHIPLKDLVPGVVGQPPFVIQGVGIGPLICHEDQVGEMSRRWAPDVGVLVNPSNLAWFEGGFAIHQQLQIARMRALEVGRPILRVGNTGVTAHIDHLGKVVSRIPAEQAGFLDGAVRPAWGMTPYVVGGDWPVVGCCMVLVSALFLRWRRLLAGATHRGDIVAAVW
jgi:apolipoprotein N-acyltransferase